MKVWRKRMNYNEIILKGGKSYVSDWIRAFSWGDQFDQIRKIKTVILIKVIRWNCYGGKCLIFMGGKCLISMRGKCLISMRGKCLISMRGKSLIFIQTAFWLSKWFQCRFTGAKLLKIRRIRVLVVRRSHDLVVAHRVNRHSTIIVRKSVLTIIVFW